MGRAKYHKSKNTYSIKFEDKKNPKYWQQGIGSLTGQGISVITTPDGRFVDGVLALGTFDDSFDASFN